MRDPDVERLARLVARVAGENPTEAVRRALLERLARLRSRASPEDRARRLLRFLEDDVWPSVIPRVRDRPLAKPEEESILGYGPDGV
jgi:antitoxin VapB